MSQIGKTQEEIGELYGLSQSAVSKILINIKNDNIRSKIETRGRSSRLTNTQKDELQEILKKSPSEYGHLVWNKCLSRNLGGRHLKSS